MADAWFDKLKADIGTVTDVILSGAKAYDTLTSPKSNSQSPAPVSSPPASTPSPAASSPFAGLSLNSPAVILLAVVLLLLLLR